MQNTNKQMSDQAMRLLSLVDESIQHANPSRGDGSQTISNDVEEGFLNGLLDEANQIWQIKDKKKFWDEIGLVKNKNGHPINNLDNALRVLEKFSGFSNLIWHDIFHDKFFTKMDSAQPREWRDTDDIRITTFFQRQLGLSMATQETVSRAVRLYAERNERNEPKDWMEALKWDGVRRLEQFFADCMGVQDSAYVRAASKNMWIGMVARIYQPGCQLDNMVVLEGAQGVGKTKALRAIGGSWYAESCESVQDKDFLQSIRGKLVVEIGELDSFRKAESTRIKAMLTCKVDRYRPSYGKMACDYPRMCIFVGTTNESHYLRDSTGARRFWPIKCGELQIGLIEASRDQLFAEAAYRYKQGENWYQMPKEETLMHQEDRREVDEWENIFAENFLPLAELTMAELAFKALKIDPVDLDKRTQLRIAQILRKLGYVKKDGRHNTVKCKFWVAPAQLPSEICWERTGNIYLP